MTLKTFCLNEKIDQMTCLRYIRHRRRSPYYIKEKYKTKVKLIACFKYRLENFLNFICQSWESHRWALFLAFSWTGSPRSSRVEHLWLVFFDQWVEIHVKSNILYRWAYTIQNLLGYIDKWCVLRGKRIQLLRLNPKVRCDLQKVVL